MQKRNFWLWFSLVVMVVGLFAPTIVFASSIDSASSPVADAIVHCAQNPLGAIGGGHAE